jgi:hypothetical protein
MILISRFQLAIVAAGFGLLTLMLAWQLRENTRVRTETARQVAVAATALAEVEKQVAAQSQRATAAEAGVGALLQTAKQTRAAGAATTASANATIDAGEAVKAAMARAKQLIDDGKPHEALEEYVRCYRELQSMSPGSTETQRLMGAMQHLARTYPDARSALGVLRDSAMAQLQAQSGRRELVFEVALLNERLGEGHRTLALYDSLPPNDRSRSSLAMIAHASFVQARRYDDALLGRSFGQMLNWLDAGALDLPRQDPSRQPSIRKGLVDATVAHIEVLTGAGKLEEARTLTEKLFAFDNSEATRASLQRHIDRAQAPRP